ncbi:MAG: bifunctional folylpolyglutamate synthase/dihydrofolate synthase [Coriobacteriia bacterium]|nr:bifunctional folylpolyglutamate synthase/dihydrofolate synthase [Coriobacteriia bacterium]
MPRSDSSFTGSLTRLKATKRWDINPSLEGTRELCHLLGDPQDSFPSIQVAGTNGKTSVVRQVAALLRAAGLRVGLYTSPELIDFNERIEICGTPISDADLARALDEVFFCEDEHGIDLTEFELTTVAAFVAFRDAQVDVGVLEVGLGGRWDATSVVNPAVAVITGIGLDHQAILGDTLEKIAAEKAAIIKPGSTAVLGPMTAVTPEVEQLILDQARACGAPSYLVREQSPLLPAGISYAGPPYQIPNIATALVAVQAFADKGSGTLSRAHDKVPDPLSLPVLQQVLDTLRIPGRFERIAVAPPSYYDGAHNPQAAHILADTLRQLGLRPTIALGVFADKDYRGIIDALSPVARDFIAIQPPTERALQAADLAAELRVRTGKPPLAVLAAWNLKELQDIAEVTDDEPLLVAGSLSLYALLQS